MFETFEARLGAYCLGRQQAIAGYHLLAQTDSIYHYTSKSALEGILTSRHLRAYNIDHQSDYTELRYAASLLRVRLDYRFAYAANEDEALLYDAMRKEMGIMRPNVFYSLSFSDDGDDDKMWRLYAERGRGYSFSVPISAIASWAGRTFFTRVIYDGLQQRALLDDLIEFVAATYRQDDPALRRARVSNYADIFFRMAAPFGFGIKLEDYASEKEWRVILVDTSGQPKEDERGRKYIEVSGPPPGALAISAICSGPMVAKNDEAERIKRLAMTSIGPHVRFFESRRPAY